MVGGGKMELWVGKCGAECVSLLHCCYMLDCDERDLEGSEIV